MNEEMKKYLTEKVLVECWHEYDSDVEDDGVPRQFCIKCNKDSSSSNFYNRTFDNQTDLMDLYQAVYEAGKWDAFYDHAFDYEVERDMRAFPSAFARILFNLPGTKEGYEALCEMVGEWHKEAHK